MVTGADIRLADGRTLRAYDTRADGIARSPGAAGSAVAVFWLHDSPNIGSPPEPLFAAAEANGLRWVSYDRSGYGGSGPHDGRTVASAAADVGAITDALGIGRFAALGHSGGRHGAVQVNQTGSYRVRSNTMATMTVRVRAGGETGLVNSTL
jgi:pimeloyl-ACP methyl ester carboxylesterase